MIVDELIAQETALLHQAADAAEATVKTLITLKEGNVEGHGAVGDGTTNDTIAVQSAINAVKANGGKTVYLPHGVNGIYKVTALTNIDGLIFLGDNAVFDGVDIAVKQLGAGAVGSSISPDDFHGTDYQKVQQALDYALENNVAVIFTKMYDITGNTLMINRPEFYYATDRKQLYLIGAGGGIKKTDSGFIFSATYDATGDINVSNLKYESVAGAGTKVWNADKIIRVMSSNCQYVNVDTIVSAPNNFTQSLYFLHEHITGGNGWKFEARKYIDTTIKNCLIEDCVNGIRNTEGLAESQNTKLRIKDNLIENLTGTSIMLGSVWSSEISGNYFELNAGYVDLKTLNLYYHMGLKLDGNMFTLSAAQVADSTPSILLGNIDGAVTHGNGGATALGNTSNGVLFSCEFDASSYITGIGNRGGIIGTGKARFIQLSRPIYTNNADGSTGTNFGFFSRITSSLEITINAAATSAYTIPFQNLVSNTDLYSVSFSNANELQLLSVQVVSGNLYVWVKNLNATSSKTVTLYGVVLKLATLN